MKRGTRNKVSFSSLPSGPTPEYNGQYTMSRDHLMISHVINNSQSEYLIDIVDHQMDNID